LVQELRQNPRQDLQKLLDRLGISRSQFYKDREMLSKLGFVFEYKKSTGFKVVEDRLAPVSHLTLSECLLVMFSLRHLCSSGDGHLVAKAIEVGRKLAGGLEEPFRSKVQDSFDRVVWKEGYGCRASVIQALESAISEGRRIEIHYQSSSDWQFKWRTVDPKHLYFLQRALYLYGNVPDSVPSLRSFRVSRIDEVRPTGMLFPQSLDNQEFYQELNNAFTAFIGPEAKEIKVKFTGSAAKYVEEGLWHHSQEIKRINKDEILFTVKVAEPKEVEWWARQFGDEAVVV
jgi:predicted DNA-binding transcriptional regulator YafY